MISYQQIFNNNKDWIENKHNEDKSFFDKLSQDQQPEYLYIGCSDSRVSAEEMAGFKPGEIFVHRNIANIVSNNDLNCISVITYAVQYLKVKHIVVCGHYQCGGVKAALSKIDMGILNPWLRNIRDVNRLHANELSLVNDPKEKYDRLVELNVQEQCLNVMKTAVVQQSFQETGYPHVHGWVFDVRSGKLKDLNLDFNKILSEYKDIYTLYH